MASFPNPLGAEPLMECNFSAFHGQTPGLTFWWVIPTEAPGFHFLQPES